jgi:nitrite reductase (cytochrome c-552)
MRRHTRGNVRIWIIAGVAVLAVAVGAGLALLLTNVVQRQAEADQTRDIVEISQDEIDPEVWGRNYPRQYDSFMQTQTNYGRTPYGGSEPYDKREVKPFLTTAWAGYGFAKDYNEDRGHYFAQVDQKRTRRTVEVDQPGACVNCHTGEFTQLVDEMGWDAINAAEYNDMRDHLSDLGMSCADCHEPDTMELRITRPAFVNAMEERGVDLAEASRQDMRTYVCAQCHVEYYFRGEGKTLTFPWSQGLSVEGIERHYDEYGFSDWTHAITETPMLKAQHPDYELYSTGLHAASDVACADCHMPYTRVGSVKVSDHWIRSPLTNLNNACGTCHTSSEDELRRRVVTIQNRTHSLMTSTETALEAAIDAIEAAMEAGVPSGELDEARQLHRSSQFRWDFIDAESSMGFHSPQEAVRVLGESVDMARQAEMSARLALANHAAGDGEQAAVR